MKLISLNTWAGRAGKESLLDFFERHKDIDIFCLQEVWHGGHHYAEKWGGNVMTTMIADIGSVLGERNIFFRPNYHDWYGLALFIKKGIKIIEEGELFVYREKGNVFEDDIKQLARNIQYVTIEHEGKAQAIVNFHGLWNGVDKDDSDDRLRQSDNIANFLKDIHHPYILCGDFNLAPEAKSLKKLENLGLRNLISEFGITSTRSSHYKKPVRFADYTLVSEGVGVNDFKVLPDEVSDHLAMYLEFS